MASFNQTILIGNITRDVLGKRTAGDTFVADFGIAVNRKFKTSGGEEREEVLFLDCTAFGKTGELIEKYFSKGKPIFVVGRLRLDQWDDKQTGAKRSKISLVVDNFQFVGGRDEGDGGGEQQTYADARGGGSTARGNGPSGSRPAPSQRPAREKPADPFGDEKQFEDADIPFAWSGRVGQSV